MYAVLRHKTTHEVSILLHKERWGSTRQNIPLESFEATIYARLDTRKKKMAYSFQTKIAAHGYHVFKILVWSNAKQCDFVTVEIKTDKELKKIDTYCCAIKAMVDIQPRLKIVGRECAKRNLKAPIVLFKRRERKSRWLHIFHGISNVSSSCRRVKNPTKTNIYNPQFYNTSENERLHDKFVLI